MCGRPGNSVTGSSSPGWDHARVPISSPNSPTRRSLIFDTDGGVDDCVALWWALTDPGVELLAVTTTSGAVDEQTAARSVLKVLAAAGRLDVPVAVGAPGRFGPGPVLEPVPFIHGRDGQGNADHPLPDGAAPVDEPAEDLLRRLVDARPGALSVVGTAPLTNLARVVSGDPGWAARVADLVVMGGSVSSGGNAQPAAEANIAGDPLAAAEVVGAAWSRPPLLVGLDATHRATLTEAEFALLAERRTPAAAFLDVPLRFYRQFGSTFTLPDCPCHDLFAMLAWADPTVLGEVTQLPLAVVTTEGPAWGATIADLRAPIFARLTGSRQAQPPGFAPWRIALGADVEAFRTRFRSLLTTSTVTPAVTTP
jgi:purine nucleosidase